MTSALLQLQRLRLSQVRKFEALDLQGLTPGLNVIAGPNGAGKSSIHRALRAAFLDRYNSNAAAADLQPLGNSAAAPSVELDFVLSGVPHRLIKTFLKKKRCDLQIGSANRSEEAAEEYLAQALGFGLSVRGSKPDVWGVPGLLWVEQGANHASFTQSVGYAAAHLNKALHTQTAAQENASAASLAASAGDALIAQLEQDLAQYVGKSGRPVGSYAQALEREQALMQEVQRLQQRIEQYRSQVDELNTLQQQESNTHLAEQCKQELAQAQQRVAQAQEAENAHSQVQMQLQQLEGQLQMAAQLLQQQEQRTQELQHRAAQVQTAKQLMQQTQQTHQQTVERLQQAQTQQSKAHAQVQQAQQARNRLQLQQKVQAQEAQVTRLQAAWKQTQHAQQQLEHLASQVPLQRIEKKDVVQLRQLEEALLRARVQHETVATQLQFELPEGQQLRWQAAGQEGRWQGTGLQWLTQPTTVQLAGGGQFTITPGGSDVVNAAQRFEHAQQAFAQALGQLQVHSVAQAQSLLEQRQEVQAQQQLIQEMLRTYAPEGAEVLKLQLQEAVQQEQALHKELQALPVLEAMDWEHAQSVWQAAQRQQEQVQQEEQTARQQLVLAEQRLHTAQEEHAVVQQHMVDPVQQSRWAQAQQDAVLLQAQRTALLEQVQYHVQQMQAADVRFAQQDIERLERSLATHAQQMHQRVLRIASLRAALEEVGAQGLEEHCGQMQLELSAVQRRVQEMTQRSQALQLVLQRLKDKRATALRRLQAPLEARMQHYLQLLLPEGRVQLDENLVLQVVLSEQRSAAVQRLTGEVRHLSYGTQEQLAIISRLAYADVLRESGHPTLIILDDALVHSDVQRLGQMKRVLFDAAMRHQILLLTCKPQDWLDAGASMHDLPAD